MDILEEWKQDYKIELDDLENSIKRISESSYKYFSHYAKICRLLAKKKKDLKILRKKKTDYYSGKADIEEYKKNPLTVKILKSDVPNYVSSDVEVLNLEEEIENLETEKSILYEIINLIKSSTFTYKNIIENRKYLEGEL